MSKPADIEQKHWDAAAIAHAEFASALVTDNLQIIIARAIQSAANAAAPKVRPLVWSKYNKAEAVFYRNYFVYERGSDAGDVWVFCADNVGRNFNTFPSCDEAKAAAQADYEQRILSALEEPSK